MKESGYSSTIIYDDRANAIAVTSGLASKENYDKVLNVLKTTKNCSVYFERTVEEALCIMGAFDECTSRTKERYATMLAGEYDTLWERFEIEKNGDPYGDGSPNHGWAGGPLIMLSKYYAGVRPTSAGFDSYDITVSGALNTLDCTVPTPKGNIRVKYEDKGATKEVVVSAISANGTVKIPVALGQEISVNGNGATKVGVENGYTVYTVTGGTYTFTIA